MVTSVKSLDDLRGRAVGTWTPYMQRLKDLGIAATPFPWDDEEVWSQTACMCRTQVTGHTATDCFTTASGRQAHTTQHQQQHRRETLPGRHVHSSSRPAQPEAPRACAHAHRPD